MASDDDALVINDSIRVPRRELTVRFTTSGGPGGQHANKTSTRAELTFDVASSSAFSTAERQRVIDRTGPTIRIVVDDARSQTRNRAIAEERLAERLRAALHVPTRRRATRPTRASQRRRVDAKRRRSEVKRGRQRPRHDE